MQVLNNAFPGFRVNYCFSIFNKNLNIAFVIDIVLFINCVVAHFLKCNFQIVNRKNINFGKSGLKFVDNNSVIRIKIVTMVKVDTREAVNNCHSNNKITKITVQYPKQFVDFHVIQFSVYVQIAFAKNLKFSI